MSYKVLIAGLSLSALLSSSPTIASETAESALAALTSAVNSIPDVVFFKDLDGVYRGGNTAWAALLGKPLGELIGKTDLELFPEEIARSFIEYDKRMLAAGQARRNNEWLVYPDGSRVYVETLKTPWLDSDGRILGLVGMCHRINTP
jgi:PAS domain S-box-containing protein